MVILLTMSIIEYNTEVEKYEKSDNKPDRNKDSFDWKWLWRFRMMKNMQNYLQKGRLSCDAPVGNPLIWYK